MFRALDDFNMQMLHILKGKASTLRLFGRKSVSVDRHHILPQAYRWATCSIGFDLPSVTPNSMLLEWRDLFDGTRKLTNTCVHRHGMGGKFLYKGLEFVIINPVAGIAEDTCLVPPKAVGLPLGRCVEAQADAMETLARNADILQTMLPHLGAAKGGPSSPLGPDQDRTRPFLSQLVTTGAAQHAITLQNYD